MVLPSGLVCYASFGKIARGVLAQLQFFSFEDTPVLVVRVCAEHRHPELSSGCIVKSSPSSRRGARGFSFLRLLATEAGLVLAHSFLATRPLPFEPTVGSGALVQWTSPLD